MNDRQSNGRTTLYSNDRPSGRRRIRRAAGGRIASAWFKAPAAETDLARELADAVDGEVRFDRGARALYATDASNYRQVPVGVVIPHTVEAVFEAIAVCRRHEAAVLPRGGGTSLAGQACNVAVIIDFSKYLDGILDLDAERRRAHVEPGCVLDTLRDAAERHGLTFGPDPATHDRCTLGGMIGNNSGGVHAVMAGLTVDNVETLEVLTYDGVRMTVGPTSDEAFAAIVAEGGRRGDIYRALAEFRDRHGARIRAGFPELPRRVSGYSNLDWLLPENGFNIARALVGSEATCVTILGATLKLVPSPPCRIVVIAGFDDVYAAADHVPGVLEHAPLSIEGIDDKLVGNLKTKQLHTDKLHLLPEGDGWLLVELGGDTPEAARAAAAALVEDLQARAKVSARVVDDADEQANLWTVREAGLAATASVPGHPDTWEGWEDAAVPRERLGDYLRQFRSLLDKYDYDSVMYGHFSDGLVHCRIDFDLATEEGLGIWRRFLDEAADLVVRFGGSLSGEHGDGEARGRLLEKMYGADLVQAFREFKAIWDPAGRMNPGKVVDPFPITANLRVGPEYRRPELATHFSYGDDEGSFARATERCVGVGKCRRPEAADGVMCPSYMATGEEMHSTRGRARLLFEMLRGDPIDNRWRSREVEEALSLCLACKGCKSDCPMHVDMATYKAEFRSHHYAGRLRPRTAYTMGLIYWWSRFGATMPRLANFATGAPVLSGLVKRIGGIAPERAMPRFGEESFTRWFVRRGSAHHQTPRQPGRRVVLWPDTFTNYFRPDTAKAATAVLEAAGFEVTIPRRPLCCGRPIYDWGMLDLAKRLWRQTLDTLRPEIEAGVPLIGLEPACLAAFKDEQVDLLPDNPLARKLSEQSHFFSDFIEENAPGLPLQAQPQRAVVQIHCHHHAVIGAKAELSLLERMGIEVAARPGGCCGMAGAFGFERDKYEVSLQAAEMALYPAVRAAAAETLILADGFSCREQIEQGTGRPAQHIADLLAKQLAVGE